MESTEPLEVRLPLSFLALLVMVANIIVCALVYVNTNKDMRTYTNSFVVSLAISDILTGVVIFFQYLVGFKSPSVLNVAYALVMLGGVTNLCAVTFDRYLAVMKPLQYNLRICSSYRKIIVACWGVSVLVSVLPLTWGGNVNTILHKIYIFAVLIVGIIAPFGFIFFADFCIFRQVRKCIEQEKKLVLLNDNVRKKQEKKRISSEAKVAKVFTLVALMFALSWFPVIYFTAAAACGRTDTVPVVITTISPFTLTLGSLINPVLYSFMKPDFRRAVRVIFGCGKDPPSSEIELTEVNSAV